jgi:type IV pilus assembly protein PilA
MKLQSKSGFSLVELMVVVAIIGILATIAVPNFQRFQARAKQASAKTELTGIYTAQKAFYVEYNTYTPDMQLTGFVPEGIQIDTTPGVATSQVSDISRIYGSSMGEVDTDGAGTTPQMPGLTVNSGANLVLSTLGLAISTDYTGAYPAHESGCAEATEDVLVAAANDTTPGASAESFVAVARGCPRGNSNYDEAADLDDWAISNLRQIANVRNGI